MPPRFGSGERHGGSSCQAGAGRGAESELPNPCKMTVVEGPSQFTSPPNSSSGKQLQVADLEELIIRNDENTEFKLPKMSSLVVVLMTNVLMQVISFL